MINMVFLFRFLASIDMNAYYNMIVSKNINSLEDLLSCDHSVSSSC